MKGLQISKLSKTERRKKLNHVVIKKVYISVSDCFGYIWKKEDCSFSYFSMTESRFWKMRYIKLRKVALKFHDLVPDPKK